MAATHTTGAPLESGFTPLSRPRSSVGAEARREPSRLQRDLRDHLLLNFTDMSSYTGRDVPVFVRGDGCHVIDAQGRRYIDGLSGLFCTNLGHSYGAEIGEAALRQMSELVFTPDVDRGAPGGDRARRAHRVARPRRHGARVLHQLRQRGRRVGLEARAAVAHRQRAAAAAQGDRAARGLPRHHAGRAELHRVRRRPRARSSRSPCRRTTCRTPAPTGTRSATTRPRSRAALLAEIEDVARVRGRRHRGDAHRRADPELRRLVHAAGRLLAGAARDLRPARHPARRRRGHHRLRPRRATGSRPSGSASCPT